MSNSTCTLRRLGIGLLLTAGAVVFAQPKPTEASVTAQLSDRIFVHGIAELGKKVTGIESIDWSAKNNRLLVDKRGTSRFFSVYTMTPEGYRLQSMVLSKPGSPLLHSGGASWHPGGDYFIFTSQRNGVSDNARSVPSIGWYNDIWLGDREGTNFWRLTNNPSQPNAPTGAVDPSFSPDGTKVFWAGNTGKRSRSPWDRRSLFIGDFAFREGTPELTEIKEFQPGENRDFYEPYGFSPDGNRVLFAGNLIGGNPWYDLDLCVIDRRSGQPIQLTDSSRVWDRFATYSPDGSKIVWTSTNGINIPSLGSNGERWERYLRSELWIMESNGRRAKQLTFFNDKNSPQYTGKRTFFGDSAFSPDGNYLAVVVYEEAINFEPESRVIMLKLGIGPPAAIERSGGKKEEEKPEVKEPVKTEETETKKTEPAKKPGTVSW